MQVIEVGSIDAISQHINKLRGRVTLVGEIQQPQDGHGIEAINAPAVLNQLNEQRTRKTSWEVENMRIASSAGARGHRAAAASFHAGGSEYDIQLAFRTACWKTDAELPYPAIVALNRNAATLHYQRLERIPTQHLSLLIDAGSSHLGYASDITRTHSDDPDFGALIADMHQLQLTLCAAARPNTDYPEVQHAAHLAIEELLHNADVIKASPEAAVKHGLTRSFYPHGLGHFLGLQVHDVGALDTRRTAADPPAAGEDKHLRLTRVLEPGNVLTIEPGIYFIDPLLEELQASKHDQHINWPRVETTKPFG